MGIDFGSEFIKVASVKPGTPFHIVVDEQSKRKVPAVVAFDNGERHFGNGAVQLAMRKPKETYLWAHRLLGKDINAPQIAELQRQGFPWEIVELPERRSLGFRHSTAKSDTDADVIFSVEEVVAMSLQHIMKIAEADAESPVKDCVITVPPYWTHRERQAMLDAAEIAGLNVLSLVNENTAAAIQYGIDRKYVANETHTIMIYNMGSTSTKVNIAHYSSYVKKERGGKSNKTIGQFEMRSMGYDDTLGGNAFEQRITDYVVEEVTKQMVAKKISIDIRKNPKAMAKIRSAAEKAKTVLSANQEAQIFLASLYEDTDFKMMVTREHFYGLVADLLDRSTGPIQQVLDDSGLKLEEIDAVVIVGGSVRIPGVQARIKDFVKKDFLTQSLNGDEAMVMGAVFRAANLSTTFQVRPFGMMDVTPYAVGVRINSDAPAVGSDETAAAPVEGEESSKAFSKRASLFKRLNRLSKKKTVQFTHTGDFECQLSHETGKSVVLPHGIPAPLDHYNVTGLNALVANPKYTDLLKEQKPRVSLSFLLDSSGVSSLVRAEATLEEMVQVPVKKAPKKDTEEKKADNDTEKKDGEEAADKKESSSDEKKDEAEKADTEEPEFTLKKKTHTIPLTVVKTGSPGSIDSLNATQKFQAKAVLEKLRRADDLKKEIAAAKNTLESYIYATRSSINEAEVEQVSTDDQREQVRAALAEAEDWLYEQGDDSSKIFKDKLTSLKDLADPIFFRLAELTELPNAVNTTQTLIAFVRKQVSDYEKNRPWVPESDRTKLLDKVDDLAEWLEEKQTAQAKLTPFEPPVLESEQLYSRLRPIHKASGELAKLKKPPPQPKKKTKTPTKNKKNDTDADSSKDGNTEEEKKEETTTTGTEKPANEDETKPTATESETTKEESIETEIKAEKKDEL